MQLVLSTYCNGMLAPYSSWVNSLAIVLIVVGSIRPFYNVVNVYWVGYYGSILAVLTDEAWLCFYSCGISASLFQGVAHELSNEAANLPELATRTSVERIADELAHITYFPVLICHSAWQTACACATCPEKSTQQTVGNFLARKGS